MCVCVCVVLKLSAPSIDDEKRLNNSRNGLDNAVELCVCVCMRMRVCVLLMCVSVCVNVSVSVCVCVEHTPGQECLPTSDPTKQSLEGPGHVELARLHQ